MWPEAEPTEQLLDHAKGGDPAAVNRLLERHREALRRLVQMRLDRVISRRVDASDVVQDVLLEASQRLADFLHEPKMPFHLWLRQLAKDHMIDMHRRHRGALRRSIDREQPLVSAGSSGCSSVDLANLLKDPELTPAAASIRRELEKRFLSVLDTLEDDDRDVILMRHWEHLSNSEVALALGITEPAAGMRYLRALRRLRALLEEPEE